MALQQNTTLTELYLGKNDIGDEGVIALGAALQHNTTLKRFHLYLLNNIGDDGATVLGMALKCNIYNLDIS